MANPSIGGSVVTSMRRAPRVRKILPAILRWSENDEARMTKERRSLNEELMLALMLVIVIGLRIEGEK